MSACPKPIQCPIHHATSAVDAIEFGADMVDKIAAMVAGIYAMTTSPTDGLPLVRLKKRIASIERLTQLTVNYAEECAETLAEVTVQLDETLNKLIEASSEIWRRAEPGTMPPPNVDVIVAEHLRDEPCTAWFDPDLGGWFSSENGKRFEDGAITIWRYRRAPGGDA